MVTKVFVVGQDDSPLMPTQPAKARRLLSDGKAKVIRSAPFTIKLLGLTKEMSLQPLVIGIDDGAKSVGVAIAQKRSIKPGCIVFKGTIDVTNQIRSKLDTRRSYRRTRRFRLRYRKPRFDNRTRTKCFVCGKNAMKGHETCRTHFGSRPEQKVLENFYLTPSIRAKKDCTLRVVKKLLPLCPLTDARVEVGRFDLQKLANPNISNVEYQQGPNYESDSVKEALGKVYGYQCNYCGATDVPLEKEHIKPRSRGGTDKWSNLCLACHPCNERKGNRTPEEANMPLLKKPIALHNTHFFHFAAQTQSGKNYLSSELRKCGLNVLWTYGRFASHYRKVFTLEKTHYNDAIVAAVTEYDRGVTPTPPVTSDGSYLVKPMPTKQRQVFNASNYSPLKGIPKGASEQGTIVLGNVAKVLVEVNSALAMVPVTRGKKQTLRPVVVRTSDRVPESAIQVFRKGDIVKGEKAGKVYTARISAIMSNGSVKLVDLEGNKLEAFSAQKISMVSRRKGVLFSLASSHE